MSLEQWMVICGLIAFVPALIYYRVKKVRLLLHLGVPILISIALYLITAGPGDREWARAILTICFLCGFAGSLIGGLVSWGTRKLIGQQGGPGYPPQGVGSPAP